MLPSVLNWSGAAALVVAPFLINYGEGKILAIVGLGLLTSQAYRLRAYNLVFLNIAGMVGYTFSLWSSTI
jgi:hypothetical protein